MMRARTWSWILGGSALLGFAAWWAWFPRDAGDADRGPEEAMAQERARISAEVAAAQGGKRVSLLGEPSPSASSLPASREARLTLIRELIREKAPRLPDWLDEDYDRLEKMDQVAMCVLVAKHTPKPLKDWFYQEVAGLEPHEPRSSGGY